MPTAKLPRPLSEEQHQQLEDYYELDYQHAAAVEKFDAARVEMHRLADERKAIEFALVAVFHSSDPTPDERAEREKWGPPVYIRTAGRHPEIIRITSKGILIEQSREQRNKD